MRSGRSHTRRSRRVLIVCRRASFLLPFVLASPCSRPAFAQQPPDRDAEVASIVSEVSAANIAGIVNRLAGFGTRHTLSDTTSDTRGIGAARRWIRSEFERYAEAASGRMSVAEQGFTPPLSARVPRPIPVVNVVATLRPPGSDAGLHGRIFLVCAHYDSRATEILDSTGDAPGADDDGSGTALVLELARVFSRHTFPATIMFAAFAGEEQGLLGSTSMAAQMHESGEKIEAVLSNDIVGSISGGDGQTDSSSVRIFSDAFAPSDTGAALRTMGALGLQNDGASRSLARYVAETGERYIPGFHVRMIYRRDRFLRGGDHMPFHERGCAAVRLSESKENFDRQHHDIVKGQENRIGDLPAFVNAGYCARIARVNAAALASLALAPPPPSNVRVMVRNLAYDTELRWSPPEGQRVPGYLVRFRATDAPRWEPPQFTRDTTVTVARSKDDFLFSVQSIGNGGSASLYAVPRPSR